MILSENRRDLGCVLDIYSRRGTPVGHRVVFRSKPRALAHRTAMPCRMCGASADRACGTGPRHEPCRRRRDPTRRTRARLVITPHHERTCESAEPSVHALCILHKNPPKTHGPAQHPASLSSFCKRQCPSCGVQTQRSQKERNKSVVANGTSGAWAAMWTHPLYLLRMAAMAAFTTSAFWSASIGEYKPCLL